MFHQVFVSPVFRDLLRFLWFKGGNPEAEIEEYRVAVNLFGASSSPGCANYAFQETARVFGEEFGELTAAFILRHFYVDDGIISVKSVEEAVDLIFSSHGMCKQGGFFLHKYSCNSQEVLDQIPDNLKSTDAKSWRLDDGNLPVDITLGVGWSRLVDCFIFIVKTLSNPATRRGMLSSLSSIYDPLGLLAPVILHGRMILREVCSQKFSWDQEVSDEIQLRWNDWYGKLEELRELQIPRCVKTSIQDEDTVQIHVFCDASTKGYGACGYLRLTDEEGTVETSLMLAKARVSPVKITSIPRLELQSAVLAVKLGKVLEDELEYQDVEVFYWSDSNVALGYIRNSTRRFHIYVSNRVAKIRERSNVDNWFHVNTEENPADAASRGLPAEDLVTDELWWKGPEMIRAPEIQFPEKDVKALDDSDPEVKSEKVVLSTEVKEDYILEGLKTISTWKKMKKSIAIWRRYMSILLIKKTERKKYTLEERPLTVTELQSAEIWILKKLQKKHFPEVYCMLEEANATYPNNRNAAKKRKATMRRHTNLYKLDTYLSGEGLLRVGGRIRRATLSHELKHPVLLPRRDHVTEVIIQHYHEKKAHSGRGITLMALRSAGFWVIRGRTEIDKTLRKCVICRKLRGNVMGQRMADLPTCRVEEVPPFTRSGMDVFGPFEIKIGRSYKKRWICIFVCMVMRAIHMEVLHNMDISSFISAFRRFQARRGVVKELYSDRGSNFIGSKNEYDHAREEMNVPELQKKLAEEDCEFVVFHFNFPKSSHMGGSWERMIRTVRSVLSRLLSQHSNQLDDELLSTMVTEAEVIVNGRPITYASMNEAGDPEPLAPIQILTLKGQVVLPPPGKFVREDMYCSRRWRRVQYLANLFWTQWTKEFVPSLQERRKWREIQENLEEDDIVLIADPNLKRCKWQMGRVLRIEPGEDDLVRKVVLKTATGELDRPIHKLVFVYRPEDDVK